MIDNYEVRLKIDNLFAFNIQNNILFLLSISLYSMAIFISKQGKYNDFE